MFMKNKKGYPGRTVVILNNRNPCSSSSTKPLKAIESQKVTAIEADYERLKQLRLVYY